jgi:hypothetical protein
MVQRGGFKSVVRRKALIDALESSLLGNAVQIADGFSTVGGIWFMNVGLVCFLQNA